MKTDHTVCCLLFAAIVSSTSYSSWGQERLIIRRDMPSYLWSKTCLAGCSANHFFDQRMAVVTLLLLNQPYQRLSNLSPMLPPFFATALFLCHFTHSLPNHHRFSAGDSIVVPIIVDIAMLYSQYCGVIG